eukprot:scaffold6002_cov376-Prasinococcus_capsulatus_cf.AAC.4
MEPPPPPQTRAGGVYMPRRRRAPARGSGPRRATRSRASGCRSSRTGRRASCPPSWRTRRTPPPRSCTLRAVPRPGQDTPTQQAGRVGGSSLPLHARARGGAARTWAAHFPGAGECGVCAHVQQHRRLLAAAVGDLVAVHAVAVRVLLVVVRPTRVLELPVGLVLLGSASASSNARVVVERAEAQRARLGLAGGVAAAHQILVDNLVHGGGRAPATLPLRAPRQRRVVRCWPPPELRLQLLRRRRRRARGLPRAARAPRPFLLLLPCSPRRREPGRGLLGDRGPLGGRAAVVGAAASPRAPRPIAARPRSRSPGW